MSESKSTLYNAFAAIAKITLRDGKATQEDKTVLQAFGKKLGITSSEYFEIMDNYMSYDVVAPYTYQQRLKSLYKITEVVHSNTFIDKHSQAKWLERTAIAIGFNPSNVKYIVSKSLDLFKSNVDMETFINGIKTLNT